MQEIKIKDITIRYDENTNIEKIKKIITNNYSIINKYLSQRKIISLIPTNEDGIDYVPNFDDFFYEIVLVEWNYEQENEQLVAISAYLLLNMLKLDKNNISHENTPTRVSKDEIYFMIALIYFKENGTINDLIDYLKNPTNTNEIVNWFIEKMRYPTYEFLLNEQYKCLKSEDFEYLENLGDILLLLFEEMNHDLKTFDLDEKINLPDVSFEEIDKLFLDFLKCVRAPKDWFNLYQEIKDKNLIEYVEQSDDKESCCYTDENEMLKIMICEKGLEAFRTLCHEFLHYVVLYNGNKKVKPSLNEFPSILFEYLSLGFLKLKGYDDETLNYIEKMRLSNNVEIMIHMYPIMKDINDLFKNGSGLIERKRNKNQKLYNELQQEIENNPELKELSPVILKSSSEDLLKKECDMSTMLIIRNPAVLLNSYQYLIGTFLTKKICMNLSENFSGVMDKVYEIVRNLNNENLKSVLEILDLKEILHTTKLR